MSDLRLEPKKIKRKSAGLEIYGRLDFKYPNVLLPQAEFCLFPVTVSCFFKLIAYMRKFSAELITENNPI